MAGRLSGSERSSSNHSQGLQDSITPMITNIVAGFNLTVEVDPNLIARNAWNVEYNTQRINAVVMRIREPSTTALIFPSGRVVVTGAKSQLDSKVACRRVVRIVRKLNYAPQFSEWKVLNMVGLIKLPFPLNMTRLAINRELPGIFEPEIFPAFVARLLRPKMTLQIFSSGKIVILGFQKEEDLDMALDQVFPVLVKYNAKLTASTR